MIDGKSAQKHVPIRTENLICDLCSHAARICHTQTCCHTPHTQAQHNTRLTRTQPSARHIREVMKHLQYWTGREEKKLWYLVVCVRCSENPSPSINGHYGYFKGLVFQRVCFALPVLRRPYLFTSRQLIRWINQRSLMMSHSLSSIPSLSDETIGKCSHGQMFWPVKLFQTNSICTENQPERSAQL